MEIRIGIVIIPNEYVIGLAALKVWDKAGNITDSVYGLFVGSFGLGFVLTYDS